MQRFFVREINNKITDQDDLYHLIKVLRIKLGDFFYVVYDKLYKVQVTNITDIIEYEIVEKNDLPQQKKITVIQGIPKNHKIDTFIKYATHFGATNIILSPMHRTTEKFDIKKIARLQKIAKHASMLSHNNQETKVSFCKLGDIDFTKFKQIIVCDEQSSNNIKNIDFSDDMCIVIGPEGGLDEKDRFKFSLDAVYISFGNFILPTEVAALLPLIYIKLLY